MRTRTTTFIQLSAFPMLLAAGLFVGCSGDDGRTDMDDASNPATISASPGSDITSNTTDMNGAASGTTTATTTDRYNPTGQLDPNGNYNADGSLRPGVILTPTQERTDAMANMNGIRATLMAELDEVRSHLKDGTLDKEHAAADQARAADLAQGLERLDRTLAAMGGATDATWDQIRAAELKESSDLRTWWNAHVSEREASAQK